jgi:hypothetical protein
MAHGTRFNLPAAKELASVLRAFKAFGNFCSRDRFCLKPSLGGVMWKSVAVVFALVSSPALTQERVVDPSALKDCPPIGQSAKGELIYGMDCAALKPENRVEVLSTMPPTNLPNTVIPQSGGKQNPDDTPTKVEPK